MLSHGKTQKKEQSTQFGKLLKKKRGERKKKDQDLERHLRKVAREDKKLRKGGKKTKEIDEVIIKMQSLHFRCKDCNKNVHDCSC